MERDLKQYLEFCKKLVDGNKDFMTVTITKVIGSAPQNLGARIIVDIEGNILFGTVGGGKVENHVIQTAKDLFSRTEKMHAFSWNLQKDIGMTCGGVVDFLFERYSNENSWNITIFGAGHVSQSLTRFLLNLDCYLTVVDTRKDWLDKLPESHKLTKIYSENMAGEVKNLTDNNFVILMTMGHATDVPILEQCLKREFKYLGVIGSKSKRIAMENELKDLGVQDNLLSKFLCPIGEPIGNNSPEEISISIIAQLLAKRDS